MPGLLRAKFKFRLVRNNILEATRTYEAKYTRMIIRQAAFVRAVAKNRIRSPAYRGYPENHTGAYRNNLRFAWDRATKTAIVGPTRLKHFNVPAALEFGGVSRWLKRTPKFYASGLQRVRKFAPMRTTLEDRTVQSRLRQFAREELGR